MTDVEKIILNKVSKIEDKLDDLMSFKFKIIGGVIVLSVLTSVGSNFLLN